MGYENFGFAVIFHEQFFQKGGKCKNKEKGKKLLLLLFHSAVKLQIDPPRALIASPLEDKIFQVYFFSPLLRVLFIYLGFFWGGGHLVLC